MIQPVGQNILVRAFEGDNISQGGIIVPDSCKKDSNKVEIVAVGKGSQKKPMNRKVGEIGYRVKDHGQEIWEGDNKYYLLDQSWIIALN
jgi:chaperonin GroES